MTQHDDYLQGILFSRTNVLDLRRLTKTERRMYKRAARRTTPLREQAFVPTIVFRPGDVAVADTASCLAHRLRSR